MSLPILVVDDEPDMRRCLPRQFRRDIRVGGLKGGLPSASPCRAASIAGVGDHATAVVSKLVMKSVSRSPWTRM